MACLMHGVVVDASLIEGVFPPPVHRGRAESAVPVVPDHDARSVAVMKAFAGVPFGIGSVSKGALVDALPYLRGILGVSGASSLGGRLRRWPRIPAVVGSVHCGHGSPCGCRKA